VLQCGAHTQVRNTLVLSHLYIKTVFYQDRLAIGTNMGKTQKDYRFVLQGSCAYRRNLTVAASSDGGASWSIEPWGLIYKGRAVRKRHSLSHFLDHFAKTGSGHTQGNAEQRWKRYVSRMQAYSNLVELPNGNIAVVFERSNSSLDEYRYVSVAIVTPTW